MRPISATTTIQAPREQLFALVSELGTRPAFTDHFQEQFRLERLASSGLGAAARFRLRRFPHWSETVIEEVEPPHRLFECGRGGRWDRVPTHTVWELTAGPTIEATEVTVTYWTEPSHPLDRMRERVGGGRWHRRQWALALRRLRQVAETGRPLERIAVAGGERMVSK